MIRFCANHHLILLRLLLGHFFFFKFGRANPKMKILCTEIHFFTNQQGFFRSYWACFYWGFYWNSMSWPQTPSANAGPLPDTLLFLCTDSSTPFLSSCYWGSLHALLNPSLHWGVSSWSLRSPGNSLRVLKYRQMRCCEELCGRCGPSLSHPPGDYSRWREVCKLSWCQLDCIVQVLTLSLGLQVWNDHLHGMLGTYISAVESPDLGANLTLLLTPECLWARYLISKSLSFL